MKQQAIVKHVYCQFLFHITIKNIIYCSRAFVVNHWFLLHEKCPYSKLFWSAFSRIRTEYGEMQSMYSVQMRENADQNNSECRHFSPIDSCSILATFCEVLSLKYTKPPNFATLRSLSVCDVTVSFNYLRPVYTMIYFLFLRETSQKMFMLNINAIWIKGFINCT